MRISQLIATLVKAQKDFGDVQVSITNGETGKNEYVSNVSKCHPYTAKYGCMNRDEPVNQVNLSTYKKSSGDDITVTEENMPKFTHDCSIL